MGIDIDEAKVNRNETGLWLGWTLATAAGLIVGYLPSAALVNQVELGLARIIVPLLAGVLIGVAQWLVLRNYVTRSADWVLNLAGSWVLGYTLGLLIVEFLANPVVGVIFSYFLFGAIIAVFQWPILRREIPHLWMWVLSSVAGWGIGALLSQAAVAALFAENPAGFLVVTLVRMAVLGLTAGAITGLALVWIVRKPERAAAV